jgi:glycolate oxidase iron-sulfur subunit
VQTHFTAAQLAADPRNVESDRILRACVHCGFCTATCPTYLLTGDELDGPRGRIYLAKDMLEKGRPADATTVKHLDRCLTCLSCMTTCPSSVNYMHLMDHAREHIEATYQRPWRERFVRSLLAFVMPYPMRFRAALALARVARPMRGILPRELRPLFDALPKQPVARAAGELPALPPKSTTARRTMRVALLTGCVQPALRPGINDSTKRVLARLGIEVVVPQGSGCCGALVHHLGRTQESLAQARADIDAWTREIEGAGLDAIVVNASGCGTMVKDYGFLFRHDAAYAEKAAKVSALARDISELLTQIELPAGDAPAPLKVAYHSACSLQHGQKVHAAPAALLKRAGFEVLDVPEGHICCGSAGTYNLLQSDLAGQLRERKVKHIESVKPDVIATGNIGCLTQIAGGTAIPIVHTIELIDWALGGPKPPELN